MNKLKISCLIALFSTFLLGGCGDDIRSKEFIVAAVVPKTGPIGYLGEQEVAGLELAAEDINKKGGINNAVCPERQDHAEGSDRRQ